MWPHILAKKHWARDLPDHLTISPSHHWTLWFATSRHRHEISKVRMFWKAKTQSLKSHFMVTSRKLHPYDERYRWRRRPPHPNHCVITPLLILIIYYYVLPKIRFTSKLLVLFQKDCSIIGSRSKILPLWRGEMVASSTYFNGIVRHKDEVFETWP